MIKPIKSLELHYPMIQFLIMSFICISQAAIVPNCPELLKLTIKARNLAT